MATETSQELRKRTPVLSIVGFILAFIAPVVGLAISIIAVVSVRRTGNPNDGLALGGVVVGALLTAGLVLLVAIGIETGLAYK